MVRALGAEEIAQWLEHWDLERCSEVRELGLER